MDNLTPMMRQYHEIKQAHPDMLLFFRLGDFYEMFYEDAITGSRELEITLTSRNTDRDGRQIPMCGIPHHAAAGYLARLLKRGHKVAVCDQVEDPRQAKGIVRREVTRILTPGTAIDEQLLESKENNFLAALHRAETGAAVAFLDVSTGEFCAAQFSGEQPDEPLLQEMHRFRPREIVLARGERERWTEALPKELQEGVVATTEADWIFNRDYAERLLKQHFQVSSLAGYGLEDSPLAVCAAGALLHYVRETQKNELSHVSGMSLLESSRCLKMDDDTVRNLELLQGMDGNRKFTLLAALDLTRTAMGGRLLRQWICRPSLDLREIERRLDGVEELKTSVIGMKALEKLLAKVHDVERLIGRVTMETANARDLLALRDSLKALPLLDQERSRYSSELLRTEIESLADVAELLEAAIDDDAPAVLGEGGLIRDGFDSELDELRGIAKQGKDFIAGLEETERKRTGISSLKVKFNRVFGYFIEVTRANLNAVPEHYLRKQTLTSAERFITPELKEYEEKVLGAEEKIIALERETFFRVRREVASQAQRIQKAARFLALLDVLLSFAEAAHRHRYVRPNLDSGQKLHIRAGRHPVLDLHLSTPFVPNDLVCDNDSDQMLILTGPNMGGKSTYLRQNALIVIMAQMGSFVPADEASIGLVDRIYTRVGAGDNLARGRSTFMTEMIETARILNTATSRSLVLLDEVGRGTATFDGLSIAWSVAEYLTTSPDRRPRTIFATHYLELTRLADHYEGVRNYCVAIRESGNGIIFFHKVMPGVANKSYGIEVAKLAGLPPEVVDRAREVLKRLERKQLNLSGERRSSQADPSVFEELQQQLF